MASVTIQLGPLDNGRRLTLDEFLEADFEEGYRYELGRGVLEVTKIPGTRHCQVVSNLYCSIAGYKVAQPRTILRFGGGNESRLWIPELASGRNPDLAVVLRDQPNASRKDPAPSLVAEVVSARSGHRDYVLKREEYHTHGIPEYWIVDFLARRFTLLIRDGDAWREQVIPDDRAIPSVVLPGLTTTVADLWADLDYYDPAVEDEDEGLPGPAA